MVIFCLKKKYLELGIEACLLDRPRSGQPKKYTAVQEAQVIALACSKPPLGRIRWTLLLLEKHLREDANFKRISRETIRLILKKMS